MIEQQATNKREWKLYVDGAVGAKGAGTGIVLQGPKQVKIEYMVCLNFLATNNTTEYEALIVGLV